MGAREIKESASLAFARERVEEWAKWNRDRGPGWPRFSVLYKIKSEREGAGSRGAFPQQMPDAVAKVDRVICRMPALLAEVGKAEFVGNPDLNSQQKANELHISRSMYYARLENFLWYIAAQLDT